MKKSKKCKKCGGAMKMDELMKGKLCGNCIKALEKVKNFKEWIQLDEAKKSKKITDISAKQHASRESESGASMWKAARKAGADPRKVVKAAKKEKDISLRSMKQYK